MLNSIDVKLADSKQMYDGVLLLLCKECVEFMPKTEISKEADKTLQAFLKQNKEFWKQGQINHLTYLEKNKLCHLIIGGCGDGKNCKSVNFQRTAGDAIRVLTSLNCEKVLLIAPILLNDKRASYLHAVTIGLYLGAYKYDEYKSSKKDVKNQKIFILTKINNAKNVLEQGTILAEEVSFARDLINKPGNEIYPEKMVKYAQKIAKDNKLKITVLDEKQMAAKKMNAILAVGQGSVRTPRMIVLQYNGNGKAPYTAYVGKGITFDSGGISIKPTEGMGEMKDDMSGAAIVLGAMAAIARMKLKINLYCILGCAENMPDGNAQRPGDIVRAANGKTIEVLSTDAEGRMVLADAVWYACQLGAKKVVDIATLTGAVIIALGNETAAIVANNRKLATDIINSGKLVGEAFWNMPATEEYHEAIKGEVSDLRNSCGRAGGCITGGLFIGEFIDKGVDWAHIDIGGTSMAQKSAGFKPKGGTAFGLMTLVKFGEFDEN